MRPFIPRTPELIRTVGTCSIDLGRTWTRSSALSAPSTKVRDKQVSSSFFAALRKKLRFVSLKLFCVAMFSLMTFRSALADDLSFCRPCSFPMTARNEQHTLHTEIRVCMRAGAHAKTPFLPLSSLARTSCLFPSFVTAGWVQLCSRCPNHLRAGLILTCHSYYVTILLASIHMTKKFSPLPPPPSAIRGVNVKDRCGRAARQPCSRQHCSRKPC